MLRKYIKATLYVVVTAFFLGSVISCEEDFRDISTGIIRNGEFTTKDTIFQIEVLGKNIENVQSDGFVIGGVLGQYLLGVYNNDKFKKIEASIIAQLGIPQDLTIVDEEYGSDTIVVTSIDTVLLRIPYNASLLSTTASSFVLDSIIGDPFTAFTLNVFRLETYLSNLNPSSPSSQNKYFSDHSYDVSSEKLNFFEDTQFKPNVRDTAQYVTRSLSTGVVYDTDTIIYTNSNPFISIPLKKNRIKELLFDQYETSNFASQDAFNNYFRGLKIQAEGDGGSLMSLSFNSPTLQPLIDIYYTNTVVTSGGTVVIDTIKKTDTFLLGGIRNSEYKMTPSQSSGSNNIAIQGTAGSMAQLKILGDDTDMNGIPDGLEDLRTENWLINDAAITLFVDKDVVLLDTIAPFQLFIYKDGASNSGEEKASQILDYTTEGVNQVGGLLQLDESNRPDSYTFKITDYMSELLSGTINDLPLLGVRAFNPTDLPAIATDTIVRSHNWSPKAVMLLNHTTTNQARRAQLKISYSIKTVNE
tara:strand:- start:1606 stop:3189 length:1584 start_codon:yes stop_codon:yes gene_type:complete